MKWAVSLAVGAAVLTGAVAAHASPSDDAVAALQCSAVYVGAASPTIDKASVGGDLRDDIRVAIVPSGGPDPVTIARTIGAELDPGHRGLTVLVFEGHSYGAASTARCAVGTAIDQAVQRHRSQLRATDDVTATVEDFATIVRSEPDATQGCATGGTATQASPSAGDGSSGSGLTALWVIVLLVAGGVALFLWSRRRRRNRELSDARAAVLPWYQRLGAEVTGLKPGVNKEAGQALRDAAERYQVAGAQLAAADSVPKFEYTGRTVLEGLYAVRAARQALGIDPGPPLPPMGRADGEYLDRPRDIAVGDQTYQGFPAYTPGAPYYFAGGYGIPGGWYGFPFWETLLVGSMLGGGLGWGLGGWGMGGWGMGGYGLGYDNGYLSGYDAGEQGVGGDDGSGWGDSGGGGTWDSGWGDSGGGWDGGGGFGGDFGGSDGGGSW
jgi:hypothetical protein